MNLVIWYCIIILLPEILLTVALGYTCLLNHKRCISHRWLKYIWLLLFLVVFYENLDWFCWSLVYFSAYMAANGMIPQSFNLDTHGLFDISNFWSSCAYGSGDRRRITAELIIWAGLILQHKTDLYGKRV